MNIFKIPSFHSPHNKPELMRLTVSVGPRSPRNIWSPIYFNQFSYYFKNYRFPHCIINIPGTLKSNRLKILQKHFLERGTLAQCTNCLPLQNKPVHLNFSAEPLQFSSSVNNFKKSEVRAYLISKCTTLQIRCSLVSGIQSTKHYSCIKGTFNICKRSRP